MKDREYYGSLTGPRFCRQGKVYARAQNGRNLSGGSFCLEYPSLGATETLMIVAALADDHSMLSNVTECSYCRQPMLQPRVKVHALTVTRWTRKAIYDLVSSCSCYLQCLAKLS